MTFGDRMATCNAAFSRSTTGLGMRPGPTTGSLPYGRGCSLSGAKAQPRIAHVQCDRLVGHCPSRVFALEPFTLRPSF
jgi:hypothetical protein